MTGAKMFDQLTDAVEEVGKTAFEWPGRVELKSRKVRLIGVRAGNPGEMVSR